MMRFTLDLYLPSFVSKRLDFSPKFKNQSGKILFVFPGSLAVYKAIRDYNGSAQITASQYAEMIKRVRGTMVASDVTRREGEGSGFKAVSALPESLERIEVTGTGMNDRPGKVKRVQSILFLKMERKSP